MIDFKIHKGVVSNKLKQMKAEYSPAPSILIMPV